MFGFVFLLAVMALGIGVVKFWRGVSPPVAASQHKGEAAVEAAHDALSLKYLDGGHGDGCNNEDDRFSLWRRRFHHFTFRSEEHTSELQSLMRISYAVFCLKKKNKKSNKTIQTYK